MSIGIGLAILLSMVLYLIDRNQKWPQAWKYFKRLFWAAIALTVVVYSYVFLSDAWQSHQDRKAAIEQAAQRQKDIESRWNDLSALELCPAGMIITQGPIASGFFPNAAEIGCASASYAGKASIPDSAIVGLGVEACEKLVAALPSFVCRPVPVVPVYEAPKKRAPVPRFGNASVIKDGAALYGPDTQYPTDFGNPLDVLTSISWPARVKVLSENKYWTRVQLQDGRIGFIGTSEIQKDE